MKAEEHLERHQRENTGSRADRTVCAASRIGFHPLREERARSIALFGVGKQRSSSWPHD